MANRKKRATQEEVNNDHKNVAATADRMGLEGEARAKYIHDHMTRFGHRPQTSYVPASDDNDNGDDDDNSFFS